MHLVELGFQCNNTCVFCAQESSREGSRAPSFGTLAAQVDAAPLDDTLAFVGGEPTLFEGLPVLVERACRRGVSRIVVQTNARRLAIDGVARSLAAAGVTALDVSLHGDSEAVHDYHTRRQGSFRQTVLGMRRARAVHLEVGTSVVVTRANFRHLQGIVRVVHTLGGRAVYLVLARPLGAGRKSASRVLPDRRMVWPYIGRAFELARTLDVALAAPDFELCSEAGLEEWFAGLGPVGAGGSRMVTKSTSRTGSNDDLQCPISANHNMPTP